MFGKKCIHCGTKSKGAYPFCPYCGKPKKSQEEMQREFGLLGAVEDMKLPFGLNFLFNSLTRELQKQMEQMDKGSEPLPQEGFKIHITTSLGDKPFQQTKEKAKKVEISEEMMRKLSELPKHEALASVRRMSNKIVYEIDLPGVKHLKDIIISRLESSVEMKAIAHDKVFYKNIPLQSQILGYKLEEGKFVIEFRP